MLPSLQSASPRLPPLLDSYSQCEENDETMSDASISSALRLRPHSQLNYPEVLSQSRMANREPHGSQEEPPSRSSQNWPPQGLCAGYSPQTPYPGQEEMCLSALDHQRYAWLKSSFANSSDGCTGGPYPDSLPSYSYPHGADFASCPVEEGYHHQGKSHHSLPGRYSPSISSLEQPYSLLSCPPEAAPRYPFLPPYPYPTQGPVCCAQCPAQGLGMGPVLQLVPRPSYRPPYYGPDHCRHQDAAGTTQSESFVPQHRQSDRPGSSTQLSLEQRKVFVTYERDSDNHFKETMNFVSLLRHNGFDTSVDVFEQQLISISAIDFMEKYINEKYYLIIIVISPKYHETVTGANIYMEKDERMLHTVYIHKQLQNEFIQNGCQNFRFIPILFPGAKKCHVPAWLQNTLVYTWPKDRDDILRRLMRVEKYNPPPVGELPTIVSTPL
ncbi:E3 ubiquitin ligase TRAF3IP2-like isoform 1-T5 [Salvelinus alpinus]|uniref:E3 ubiquitin ligase TRAF3IP2 n=2 Tax=Salvelinus namaycush TaxID=8040 RepID=A0A8U0QS57_SALNM|nr:adapter protein CIKS isoform X1 [Salvelinus alpinus]XP_023864168.1 adapter protein CIKS isoform X1 [Salvelinus alpinus]XP_038848271.1 E3 ubiquitin ligase TRAF3IP2-like isoform X1 [Salvelinus namaycush]XP_038848273.1 E3 ubiquitin ligase TRAF3IP2-like isoform X1 [Salvelinus namaycush]